MKRLCLFVAALMFALSPAAALAWNDTGHMIVALMAYRQLDDAQKQQVAGILKAHPHYQLYLAANLPAGVNEDEWAFIRAATWPDFVRPNRPGDRLFKGPEITRFHQSPWHYVEYPWVSAEMKKTLNPTTLPTHAEPNIITALDQNAKAFVAADAKPEDRAVALAWIEHLIGDIHQPLHACTAYTSAVSGGDRGGNETAVRVDGWVMRLHSYWDEAIGTSDAFFAINVLANGIATDPQLDAVKLPELKTDQTFSSWADESHDYAIAFAHLNGRLRSAAWAPFDTKQITAEQVPTLPPSYAGNTREVVRRRAATASYRLAAKLKELLSPATSAVPSAVSPAAPSPTPSAAPASVPTPAPQSAP